MNNDEIIFSVENIDVTTGALLEDVLNDKPLGVAFAIDPTEKETNYWKDPYVKFYPDSSNRDKAKIVYRVYLKRAAFTVHRDGTGKETPTTMNRKRRDLLVAGMDAMRLPTETQLSKKHKDLDNSDLVQTYDMICRTVDRIAKNKGIEGYEPITGKYNPDYNSIEFEKHS